MSGNVHLLRTLLAMIALGFPVACAAVDLKSPKTWFPVDDTKPQQPGSITAVWSPALLQRNDGTRARGFGGRLMFYGPKGRESVRVDGALVVYAYDDDNVRGSQSPRPSRKYVFTREQFLSHYSKSDLGHSYSVWIPWDHVEGTTKRISLIARFSPVEGSAVVSEQAQITLPGTNITPTEEHGREISPAPPVYTIPAPVQAASHLVPVPGEAQAGGNPPSSNGPIKTATIRIPSRAQQR